MKTWKPNAVQKLSEQAVKEYAVRYNWLRNTTNNQKERLLSMTADCWGIYLDQAIDKAIKEETNEPSHKVQD